MAKKLTAIMIIEVAGRPVEYLANSLKIHVEKLKGVKGINLISAKVAEPKKVEGNEEIYTTYAEVEIEVESLFRLTEIVFEYMPSSIEIIDPAEIEFNSQEATVFMNDLAGRLHKYDDIAKIAQMQIKKLNSELQQFKAPPKKESAFQPLGISLGDSSKKEEKTTEDKKSDNNSKKKKKK